MNNARANVRSVVELEAFHGLCHDLYITKDWPETQVRAVLEDRFNVSVSERQLKNQFESWGFQKHTTMPVNDTPGLRERIKFCFQTLCMDDDDILAVLQAEGYDIQPLELSEIRHAMGLHLQTPQLPGFTMPEVSRPRTASSVSTRSTRSTMSTNTKSSVILEDYSICEHLNLLGIPVEPGRVGFATIGCRQYGAATQPTAPPAEPVEPRKLRSLAHSIGAVGRYLVRKPERKVARHVRRRSTLFTLD